MTHEEYESKSQMKRVEILKAAEKQMTHKELLERVAIVFPWHIRQALRAVVELHKPGFAGDLDEYSCQECSDFEDSNYRIYPCQTIQAIEKELG